MNLYRITLTSPRPGSVGVVIYRLGVAAVMNELRRANRWGYTHHTLELG